MINPFQYKSESEIKGMLKEFFSDCEYMVKVRILLKAFPGYSITKLESRGIAKMWKALSLERQKDIYQDQYKYQI